MDDLPPPAPPICFGKDNLNFDLIYLEILSGFNFLNESANETIKQEIFNTFVNDFWNDNKKLTSYNQSKTFLQNQPNLFLNTPFTTVNMMTKCKINCIEKPDFFFDLDILKNKDDEMYYSNKSVPSMMMPMGTQSCTARFTSSGFITMTGGCSVKEIIYWMTVFCQKVFYYLSFYSPNNSFYINGFHIHNRVCKTRIPYKVDIMSLAEYLRTSDFKIKTKVINVKYNPDRISLIYLYILSVEGRKVTVSIGPNGGIVVLAFKYNYEILLLTFGLTQLITNFIRESLNPSKKESKSKKRSNPRGKKIKNNTKWRRLTNT